MCAHAKSKKKENKKYYINVIKVQITDINKSVTYEAVRCQSEAVQRNQTFAD